MPELAEVHYYAQQWQPGVGQRVKSVELHPKTRVFRRCDTDVLEQQLPGAKLQKIHTHGKQMLFEFSQGGWLFLHLGMTGELSTALEPYESARHDHLVLHLSRSALIFRDPRQFGAVQFHQGEQPPEQWTQLPPEIADAAYTRKHLSGFLKRHPRTPLKSLLLDQAGFPGIGNWMADEVLWQMKVSPYIPAGDLDEAQIKDLHQTLKHVCKVSLSTIGVDWGDPPKTWLFRHRWAKGHACPRCGGALQRETLRGRTACWCPVCQGGEKPGTSG